MDCSLCFMSVALWESIPFSCRGSAQHREPGVPTLARVMQVWLMYPRGTNWSLQASHRHARIQLDLKPCNDLAPLAPVSPGGIWICSKVYSLMEFPLLITL